MANSKNVSPDIRAKELLEKCGFHKIPIPVERIAKSLGAQVRYSPLDEELSGMVFIKDGIPIIGVNSLHHPNRQRFTIALFLFVDRCCLYLSYQIRNLLLLL